MTSLASVFVEVRPDTSGFSADLKRNLAKTREAVDVAAKLDTSKLKPQLDALKADLRAVSVTKANITAESSQVSAQIRTLKLQLKDLNTKAKIEGDGGDFTSAIRVAKAELASLQDTKVRLSVDSSQASAHLKALNAQLGLFDRDRTVDVDVKGGGGLSALSGRLSEVGASMSGIMTKAGAVGPAILALGSAMSAAAAGGTQLIATLGPAAAGAGVFGLAVAGQVEEMKKAQEEIKKKNDAVSKAQTIEDGYRIALKSTTVGSAEYKAAQTALQAAHAKTVEATRQARVEQQSFNQAFGPAAAGLNKFKDAYQAFLAATGSVTVNVMGDALQLAASILPRLVPLANGAGRAIGGLVRQFEGFTRGAQFANLLRFFEREGPAAITSFGHILGNLGVALGNIFAIGGSGGSGKALLGTVESLTVRFREWTGSANGAASIAKWFAQGRTNLAAISGLVKDVFGGMKDIGSGRQLAPLINQIRREVIPPLMQFLNNASASGALGALVTAVGRVIGVFAKLAASDGSLKAFAVTLGALATAAGWIVDKVPGASTALGAFFTVAGGAAALKLVGIGNGLASLRTGFMLVATATGRATIAQNLNAASAKASAAATAVMAGVQKAAAIATTLWTGAVRLLNLAWRANPIGLVITGLTLLGAGLVLAYKKSETFRRIVDGAFAGVKAVAANVVGWFQRELVPFFTRTLPAAFQTVVGWVKRNWPVILAVLTGPIGLAVLAISKHWRTIKTVFTTGINAAKKVVSSVSETIRTGWNSFLADVKNAAANSWKTLKTTFSNAITAVRKNLGNVQGTIRKAWGTFLGNVKTDATNGWRSLKKTFSDAINAVRKNLGTVQASIRKAWGTFLDNVRTDATTGWRNLKKVFSDAITAVRKNLGAVQGTIGRAWGTFFDNLRTTAGKKMGEVKTKIDTILGNIKKGFGAAVTGIQKVWAKLEGAVKPPVRFIIGTVWNRGLQEVISRIPGIPHPGDVKGFASGGVLPGYTPGRDVHRFVSRSAGELHLSGGEAIMRPEFTRAVGPRMVDRWNALARRGGPEAVKKALLDTGGEGNGFAGKGPMDVVRRFAGGGVMDRIAGAQKWARSQAGKPYIWGGVGPRGYDCSGFMSAITNILRGRAIHSRVGATSTFPWGGFVRGPGAFTIGSTPNYGGSGVGHMAGTLGGLNVESRGGRGVVLGGNARGFRDSGFSQVAHLGTSGSAGGFSGGGGPVRIATPWSFPNPLRFLKGLGDWKRKLSGMGYWGKALTGLVSSGAGAVKNYAMAGIKKAFSFITGIGGWLKDKLTGTQYTSNAGAMLNAAGQGVVNAAANGTARAQVKAVASRFGWGSGAQWSAIDKLVQAESSWNVNAANPTSSARGLFQKMTSIHGPVEKTAAGQAQWGLNYIRGRYGGPIKAWDFHRAHNYYGSGGVLPQRLGVYDRGGVLKSGAWGRNISGQPERVLDPRTTRNFERLTTALDRMDADRARGGGASGPQRFVLDIGGGRVLTGYIDDRVAAAKAISDRRAAVRRKVT